MAVADGVAKEAAWMQLEPAFVGCPPLQAKFGGPFDIVEPYGRKTNRRARELYVNRDDLHETRISMGGEKQLAHFFHLTIWWPIAKQSMADELAALDQAVDNVLTRVRAVLGDKTHGGRFLTVADTSLGEPRVKWEDPFTAASQGSPLRVDITYVGLEWLTA